MDLQKWLRFVISVEFNFCAFYSTCSKAYNMIYWICTLHFIVMDYMTTAKTTQIHNPQKFLAFQYSGKFGE